ncbi:MAG: hypothetical protein RLZZ429_904 [Bacteroidota bacterium]
MKFLSRCAARSKKECLNLIIHKCLTTNNQLHPLSFLSGFFYTCRCQQAVKDERVLQMLSTNRLSFAVPRAEVAWKHLCMISKKIQLFLFCLVMATGFSFKGKSISVVTNPTETLRANTFTEVYENLDLASLGLSKKAYEFALEGYDRLKSGGQIIQDHILSVVDFSLPSNQKRLFVIDLLKGELLFHTFVSHGKNSGKLIAKQFSNKASSFQSSIGFYTTGEPYLGKHGLSLRLIGKEKGINDKALQRGIVIHGADYAEEDVAIRQGYLGRSLGCPAVPQSVHRELISTIQNGTCFFIYAPMPGYSKQSKLI